LEKPSTTNSRDIGDCLAMPWAKVDPVWKLESVGLCGYPYHNHSHGCSNFCKRAGCPPTMVPLEICLDECYFIYTVFPIKKHVQRMMEKHPEWSIYQARNIYYWQSTARVALRKEVDKFLSSHPRCIALGPKIHLDSWGIDMTATMAKVGIDLWWGEDWGSQNETYLLRYAGFPVAKAGTKRLKRLERKYPIIYERRSGKCRDCPYRPCLRYLQGNPQLYVSKIFGTYKIEKYLSSRNCWVLRCTLCGRRRVSQVGACLSLTCKCQGGDKQKPPSANN